MKKKYIKSATASILLFSMLSTTTLNVSAESKNGVELDDPAYSKKIEYYQKLEKERDLQIEKQEKKKVKTLSSSKVYTIPVKYIKQQYSNYCGVAAGISALSFHKTKSKSSEKLPTQKHFGNTVGTLPNKGGTSSTYLTAGLNKYKTVFKFKNTPYIMGNVAQFSRPEDKISSRIKSTLSSESTAPILLTRTYKLTPRYTKNYRHYVTVSGYNTKNKKIRLVDPNHHTKFTGGKAYWANLGSKTKNGVTKSMYKADIEGNNAVMIW